MSFNYFDDLKRNFHSFQFQKFSSQFPQVDASIELLEKIQTYQYKDRNVAAVSLIHRSCFVYWPHDKSGILSNENLEFLGDSFLNYYAALQCMIHFPNMKEGELSKLRAALVSTESLAKKTKEFGITDCLLVGKSEEISSYDTKENVLADIFESVTAALLIDGGEARCFEWLQKVFGTEFESGEIILTNSDAKGKVQQWSQSFLGKPPVYEVVGIEGTPHERFFIIAGFIGNLEIARAKSKSKRSASKLVAKEILDKIESGELTQEIILHSMNNEDK